MVRELCLGSDPCGGRSSGPSESRSHVHGAVDGYAAMIFQTAYMTSGGAGIHAGVYLRRSNDRMATPQVMSQTSPRIRVAAGETKSLGNPALVNGAGFSDLRVENTNCLVVDKPSTPEVSSES